MSNAVTHIASATVKRRTADAVLLGGFAASLFASALLLFFVEPVVARLVLPRLGGSPAVWNTCVCFFQGGLLLGYGYAHLVATRLRPLAQVIVHGLVLAVAVALMPLSLGTETPPPDAFPVAWLFWLLARRIALPFFAIAATAPLVQSWFARTTHPQARDPYFLYAASNAGSLVALIGYPVLIEPTLDLSDQVWIWSICFAATTVAVMGCGLAGLVRGGGIRIPASATAMLVCRTAPRSAAIGVTEQLRWVLLAFVPSALMLAVTTHITTDVAAAPLFWMVPLAIYILTFVLAFGRNAPLEKRWLVPLQGVALAAAGATGFINANSLNLAGLWALLAGVPLAAFALSAAVCHGELARRRPDPVHLTRYFLLMSVGGALGGVFNVLLAPMLFKVPLEYPILLIAACLLRPMPAPSRHPAWQKWSVLGDILLPVALLGLALLLLHVAGPAGAAVLRPVAGVGAVILPGAILLWFARRRLRLALALAACLMIPMLADASHALVVERNFFGVVKVKQDAAEGVIDMVHGTTIHGVQSTRPGEKLTPLSYYHRTGPFGRLFAALDRRATPVTAVGVVGLGIGQLACYAQPGATWTFREINPLVERLARDDHWFHFMHGCADHVAVVLGDARLTLAADTTARYDVLIVDAFSSDSVPIHLITREALAMYLSHLKPDGMVVFHVSNRYLDLVPVVARLAADAGAPVRHLAVPAGESGLREPATEVVALALPGGNLDALATDGWDIPKPGPVLWSDERSDIVGVIRW